MHLRTLILLVGLLQALPVEAKDPPWTRINNEEGVTVHSKEVPGSDLVAFKGETTIKQPLAKILAVLVNNSRFTEWVDRLKTSKILKKISKFEYIVYQHFELPICFSDRDYVYRGKATRAPDGVVTLLMQSCKFKKAPETVGVRAELLRSRYRLIPKGKSQTTIEVEIHTDPKGMIPAWLVNSISKEWPVITLKGVRDQARRKDVKPYPLPPITDPKGKKKTGKKTSTTTDKNPNKPSRKPSK